MDAKAKNDQIIRETIQKLAQVILQARILFPITPSSNKRINKWFNLETEELDVITREMTTWQGNLQAPLYLEIYFASPEPLPSDYSPLMERWKIVYSPSPGMTTIEFPTVYKHLVLLVRGVAGLLRVMPAFRAFRNCQKAKSAGIISSGAEIRYSFHSSFPSSREFSPSRATSEFTFDPIISPFGSLTVTAVYRADCSVEIGATDPIIKAHFIKDYSPSPEYVPSTSPPKRYSQEPAPRSAPIGIPGKDTTSDMLPMISSPPSSLTMMSSPGFLADPSQPKQSTPPSSTNFYRQNPIPHYSGSTSPLGALPNQYSHASSTSPLGALPNQYSHPSSTSPVGIPPSSNPRMYSQAFSSSPTGYTNPPFNSSATSAGSNSSTSTSGGSTGFSNTNIPVNTSGKLRPRAASYAPPSSTNIVSPPSTFSPLSGTPPYSSYSVYPRLLGLRE